MAHAGKETTLGLVQRFQLFGLFIGKANLSLIQPGFKYSYHRQNKGHYHKRRIVVEEIAIPVIFSDVFRMVIGYNPARQKNQAAKCCHNNPDCSVQNKHHVKESQNQPSGSAAINSAIGEEFRRQIDHRQDYGKYDPGNCYFLSLVGNDHKSSKEQRSEKSGKRC